MLFVKRNIQRSGMTLIELLISLSIIAIMTAITMPMLSSYQRKASLNTDTQSIAQLIEYARTLHNNADYQRYDSATSEQSSYAVELSEDGGNYLFELFSLVDQETILDSVRVSDQSIILSDSNFFSLYGNLGSERLIGCGGVGSGLDNCPKPFEIKIRTKGAAIGKIIRVHHTNEPFSVEVLNEIDES